VLGRLSATAALALTAQDDLVRGDIEGAAVADCVDRLLEGLIAERDRPAAAVADQVVVVVTAGEHQLEAGWAVREGDALEQAEVGEQPQRPVNARCANPFATLAQALGDDVGVYTPALISEQLDDGLASPAGAVAFAAQDLIDALAPCVALAHRRPLMTSGRSGHAAMIARGKR
jgi:hypothetical protein